MGGYMTKRILLADGDIIAFRCAAANESRSIKVTHKVTGQVTEHAHRTAFKEHIKDKFDIDEFDIEDVREAEKISFAYNAINTTIEALKKSCECDEVEVYLSGKTNFRDSLPLPTKYKSGRENLDKPVQLGECREYLKKKYKCFIADNKEADDDLTIRSYELRKQGNVGIVASIDKDAYGTDIWLYNWTKMDKPIRIQGLGFLELDEKKVLRGQGRLWYYAQWVKGDPVDCFKPCEISGKKFGDVGCYNLLADCKTDKEAVEAVYKQYKTWYPKEPIVYSDWQGIEQSKSLIELMDVYAACSHMKRSEDDVFSTEKLLNNLGINWKE
jgi:hypothetical protein